MDQDSAVATIEQAIDHLMRAGDLVGRLPRDYLEREALRPIAQAAATLRTRAYELKSMEGGGGERWPPAPEVSG
ncbi:MAG: hypothetical protein ACRDJJ_04050 [Actinomycetota bacterium]